MSFYKIEDSLLSDIADAIRSQTGGTSPIAAASFPSAIQGITGDNGNFKLEIEAADYYSLSDTQCSALKQYCFYRDDKITGVNFENVLSIGISAFYGCSKLAAISFPKCEYVAERAFYQCASIATDFYAPSCSYIGTAAFYACNNLQSITLGSVSQIGENAFNTCTNLKEVTFDYCDTIVSNAFTNCSRLSKVEGVVKSMYKEVFMNCTKLTDFNFESIIYLGPYAFANTGFTSVELPVFTKFTNNGAFSGCKSLTKVSIPLVTSIFSSTFDGCILLSDIYAPNVTNIETQAFRSTIIPKVDETIFSLITSIPNSCFAYDSAISIVSHPSITFVGTGAFVSCSSLATVNLPALSSIGTNAFAYTGITEINLSLLSSIPTSCFYSCKSLTSVSLGTGNITLSQGAFLECSLLSEITNLSYVTNLGFGALQGTTLSEINLPNLATMSTSGNNCMNNSQLQTVSLSGTFGKIQKSAFANCPLLTSLYLLNTDAIIQLNSSAANVFNSSPLKPGGLDGVYGSIYVPATLYNNYLANASWAAIVASHAGTFVSIT